MSVREIDITEQFVNCIDLLFETPQPNVEKLEKAYIEARWDLFFDETKYFGIPQDYLDDEDITLDFYTRYYEDGHVEALYTIQTADGYESFDWKLTDKEQEFFRIKMDSQCIYEGEFYGLRNMFNYYMYKTLDGGHVLYNGEKYFVWYTDFELIDEDDILSVLIIPEKYERCSEDWIIEHENEIGEWVAASNVVEFIPQL